MRENKKVRKLYYQVEELCIEVGVDFHPMETVGAVLASDERRDFLSFIEYAKKHPGLVMVEGEDLLFWDSEEQALEKLGKVLKKVKSLQVNHPQPPLNFRRPF